MSNLPLRHAYMIITHGSFEILEKQLRFLDSENADFFIHLDTHVKEFDFDYYRSIPKKSKVTFVDRIRISWGHFSLVECELILLKAALPGHYDYYHLLSGVDVPLKSREYIENFFTRSPETNYIHFQYPQISSKHYARVKYYFPFQRWNIQNRAIRLGLRKLSTGAQLLLRVDRTRKYPKDYVFQKGAQWFSITHALAEYTLEHEAEIYEKYHDSFCGDEVFLQSTVLNSPFKSTLPETVYDGRYENCCRYIDWERGRPYCFRDGDYDELISTPPEFLFARKFNYKTDPQLVDRLFAHFSAPEETGP